MRSTCGSPTWPRSAATPPASSPCGTSSPPATPRVVRAASVSRSRTPADETSWPSASAIEALINLAFDGGLPWRLACPYDTAALEQDVIDEALRSHPVVRDGDEARRSPSYSATAEPFEGTLPEPPPQTIDRNFGLSDLANLRQLITDAAAHAGLRGFRLRDLVLSVNEVASNSVRHGGGGGLLRVWRDHAALFWRCRIRARSTIPWRAG